MISKKTVVALASYLRPLERTRPQLSRAQICETPKGVWLVATDSFSLAAIATDDLDSSYVDHVLTLNDLRAWAVNAKAKDSMDLREHLSKAEGLPSLDSFLNDKYGPSPLPDIWIQPKLLRSLTQVITDNGEPTRLEFGRYKESPIRVSVANSKNFGIIMPVRAPTD